MDISQYNLLNNRLFELPTGGITYKTISGKKYAYYQWSENGKQHARRVKDDELEELSSLIDERKSIQSILKGVSKPETSSEVITEDNSSVSHDAEISSLSLDISQNSSGDTIENSPSSSVSTFECPTQAHFEQLQDRNGEYYSIVKTGNDLLKFCESSSKFHKNSLVNKIHEYISRDDNRYIILYGLQSSGKTTTLLKTISTLDSISFEQTAYVLGCSNIDINNINEDIYLLYQKGFQYIFIDDVTSVNGFIDGASTLLNQFSKYGIKFILSGNDSFSFVLAELSSLHNKFYTVRTSFIPYRDYILTYPDCTVDDYIKLSSYYDVTSSSDSLTFPQSDKVSDYLKNAVVQNVLSSVSRVDPDIVSLNYPNFDSYSFKDLVYSTINHLNYSYILNCLTSSESSEELGILFGKYVSGRQLSNLREAPDETVMSIINSIDLVRTFPQYDVSTYQSSSRSIFSQFGIRYSLISDIIKTFTEDKMFSKLSYDELKKINSMVEDRVMSNLILDLCLKESSFVFPDKEVYSITGLKDLVDFIVYDKASDSYDIYKISRESFVTYSVPKTFSNKDYIELCSHRFGTLNQSYYIYFGKNVDTRAAKYINIYDYLKGNIKI